MLGKKIRIIKYKNTKYRVAVPELRIAGQRGHIIKWRKDLLDSNGRPLIENEESAILVGEENGYKVYETEQGKRVAFPVDDWQLVKEFEYGFTTVRRWDKAPNIPEAKLLEAIRDNEWVFAKTMPNNPHYYALRTKWNSASGVSFDDFVLVIRGRGEDKPFWGVNYRNLTIGDYYYWTMGAPLTITVLINRKKV